MTALHTSPMYEVARELDRVLHGGNGVRQTPRSTQEIATPAVQVWEAPEAYTVALILPGLDHNSLDIEASSHLLKVKGKTAFAHPQNGELRYGEFKDVEFQRHIKLSQQIKIEGVTADYRDGLLTIVLPKADVARSVKVQLHPNGGHSEPSTAVNV